MFPANRPEKSTPEYIANLTREPLTKNIKPVSKLSPQAKHKVKMAEQRRTQLREGLTALKARKEADLTAMSRRSQQKQLERSKLLTQSEREDARLTNTTVPTAMQPSNNTTTPSKLSLAALEAELTHARTLHAQKVTNYTTHKSTKHAEKMDALHTLYMSARTFVTTEEQLEKLLAEQFEDPSRFTNDIASGDSMWQFGPPESVKDMIGQASGKPGRRQGGITGDMLSSLKASSRLAHGIQVEREQASMDQERLKRIAEKLSGGKI